MGRLDGSPLVRRVVVLRATVAVVVLHLEEDDLFRTRLLDRQQLDFFVVQEVDGLRALNVLIVENPLEVVNTLHYLLVVQFRSARSILLLVRLSHRKALSLFGTWVSHSVRGQRRYTVDLFVVLEVLLLDIHLFGDHLDDLQRLYLRVVVRIHELDLVARINEVVLLYLVELVVTSRDSH